MASEMPSQKWQTLVEPHFGFLRTEHQCVVAERSDEHWWCTRIVYQNATTAVEIVYSVEFECVEVQLVRLVDGQRPPYPVFVSEEPLLHHFSLDHLVKLRAAELVQAIEPHVSLDAAEVEVQLSSWADALKQFGADVLQGDFHVFEVLEADLREHVGRNPEQITAWSPHSAKGPDQARLAKLRAQFPTVPVVVREYARPTFPLVDRVRRLVLRLLGGR